MVRVHTVIARVGVFSLVVLGCSADANDVTKVEEQLNRIEARLDRVEERLRSQEHAVVTAQQVTIDLPQSEPTPALSRVEVSVTATQVLVNGDPVASVALRAMLETLAASSPDASVVVKADPSVQHQRVIDTMQTVKNAGFSRIAIATRSDD